MPGFAFGGSGARRVTFTKNTPETGSQGHDKEMEEDLERKMAALGDDAGLLLTDAAHLVCERVEAENRRLPR